MKSSHRPATFAATRTLLRNLLTSVGMVDRRIMCCGCRLLVALAIFTGGAAGQEIDFRSIKSPTEASLRGVSAVSDSVFWASGAQGTILRSVDGGKTIEFRPIPGCDDCDFRDIQAWDENRCSVMIAGQPARFYFTEDGGDSWALAFEHKDESAFFDAMSFWDSSRGIAFGDAIDGHLVIVSTEDGGKTWSEHPKSQSPAVAAEEHGYAASGSCLTVGPKGKVWIGLGGSAVDPSEIARIFRSDDFGRTWTAASSDLRGTASAGVFSLLVTEKGIGIAVGGDYEQEENREQSLSISGDGGKSWQRPAKEGLSGYRSSVVSLGQSPEQIVATGPSGTDLSSDQGKAWKRLDMPGFHAMDVTYDKPAIWAIGSKGRIGLLRIS